MEAVEAVGARTVPRAVRWHRAGVAVTGCAWRTHVSVAPTTRGVIASATSPPLSQEGPQEYPPSVAIAQQFPFLVA